MKAENSAWIKEIRDAFHGLTTEDFKVYIKAEKTIALIKLYDVLEREYQAKRGY